jgi:hypothetical protein
MTTSYEDRLRIPLEGNEHTRFETSTRLHVATGYTRVVIGGRGPYFEFNHEHIILANLHVPENKRFKLRPDRRGTFDYIEWRTNDDANVKVYEQVRTVDYADYRVGLIYVSPFDLFVQGKPVITKLEKRNSRSRSE